MVSKRRQVVERYDRHEDAGVFSGFATDTEGLTHPAGVSNRAVDDVDGRAGSIGSTSVRMCFSLPVLFVGSRAQVTRSSRAAVRL